MTQDAFDRAEEVPADFVDNVVPTRGCQMTPLVGLGGSAGGMDSNENCMP